MVWRLTATVLVTGLLAHEPAYSWRSERKPPAADWLFAEAKLKNGKVKPEFVEILKSIYQSKDFDKVLELNLLLYLKKTDYHGPQATPSAVGNIKSFMRKNKKALDQAEKEYGVPGEIISSLLWLESRYGKNKGRFHVASAYLHLLQADRPDVVKYLKKKSLDYLDEPSLKVRKEIEERCTTKAKWALKELKALAKMHKKDEKLVKKLKGSFAGALGMPQFIPSSYVAYAKSAKKDASPDLTQTEDAILSVANYLKKNGWRKSEKSHAKALHEYNKSDDYVNAILDMAAKAKGERGLSSTGRKPAAQKTAKKSKKSKKSAKKPSKAKAQKAK